ncbi:hypothetical protein EIP86_006830 [Pleurotus ostreatoroseus]|nr:hypothetical protein EIP86_006830 [Pleurotus ostreatoroseus]
MSIAIAEAARPQARRGTSTPSTPSLINRIQKPPLLDRLTQKESKAKSPVRTPATPAGPGPIRNKPRAPKAARAPKKPKTAEELDSELDAFMKDDTQPTPTVPEQAGDVEMTE